jgi:RNA polymerase sigma-32 factor
VPVTDVETMETRLGASDQSLDMPVSSDGDGIWQDFMADTRPTPEQVVTGLRDSQTRSRWLNDALRELSDREQTIIRRRRLRENGATLEELGKTLGVSKERVRQLEQRAMEKLRDHIVRRADQRMDLFADV